MGLAWNIIEESDYMALQVGRKVGRISGCMKTKLHTASQKINEQEGGRSRKEKKKKEKDEKKKLRLPRFERRDLHPGYVAC